MTGRKIELLEVGKSNPIKTEVIQTESIHLTVNEDVENYSVERIKEQIDYEHLKNYCPNVPLVYLDMVVLTMETALNGDEFTQFRVNNKNVPYEKMKEQLLSLNHMDIEYAVETVINSGSTIKNPQGYFLAVLYSAKSNFDFSVTNSLKKNGLI